MGMNGGKGGREDEVYVMEKSVYFQAMYKEFFFLGGVYPEFEFTGGGPCKIILF
jgi:hypothetical protein